MEGLLVFILVLIFLSILGGLITFIVGLFMKATNEKDSERYLAGEKYLKKGLKVLIIMVVLFIIGFSICLSTLSLGNMH